MSTVELLQAARELLADGGWYRGVSMGDEAVHQIRPGKTRSDCHCVATAVTTAGHVFRDSEIQEGLHYVWLAVGSPEYVDYTKARAIHKVNDAQPLETGYEWALGIFDRAIALAVTMERV